MIQPHSIVYKNNDGEQIMNDDLCQTACSITPNLTYACDVICLCSPCHDSDLCENAHEIDLIAHMCFTNIKNETYIEVVHPIVQCRHFNQTVGNILCEQVCDKKCFQKQICNILPKLEGCFNLSKNSYMIQYQTSNQEKIIGFSIVLVFLHLMY
jgi:hypothetical protein